MISEYERFASDTGTVSQPYNWRMCALRNFDLKIVHNPLCGSYKPE